MSDEQNARNDFDQGQKQPFGSFAYQDTYRQLEQERERAAALQPLGGAGQVHAGAGEAFGGTLVGGAALLPILLLVAVGAAIFNDVHVQATIVGVAALLFLAVLAALITRPLIAWVRKPGAAGPPWLRLSLVNAAIALFHGGLFAWVRDTLPDLRPEQAGKLEAAGFAADVVIAASQLVQSLLTLLGRPLPVRDGQPFAFAPGAAAFLAVAGILLLVPALVYALAIGRAARFPRALAISLPVQAFLFVACIYGLASLQGALGLRIFA